MNKTVKALVITGFGLNCESETSTAFDICGAESVKMHLNDLAEDTTKLHDFQILVFIGGFSFGDHLGAGTVFASRVKHYLRADLEKFIAELDKLGHIKIEGLMTIAPQVGEPKAVRPVFAKLKQVYDTLADRQDFRWLSMGMTDDLEVAVEEGANMVRIGRAVFAAGA